VFERRPADDHVEGPVLGGNARGARRTELEGAGQFLAHAVPPGRLEEDLGVREVDVEPHKAGGPGLVDEAEVEDAVARPDVRDLLSLQADALLGQELDGAGGSEPVVVLEPRVDPGRTRPVPTVAGARTGVGAVVRRGVEWRADRAERLAGQVAPQAAGRSPHGREGEVVPFPAPRAARRHLVDDLAVRGQGMPAEARPDGLELLRESGGPALGLVAGPPSGLELGLQPGEPIVVAVGALLASRHA